MTSEPDYYTVLGLMPRSDLAAIRDQYRRLAKVFHPDRNDNDPWCQEQLKRINKAYEFLADPSRKAAYDTRYRTTPLLPAAARPEAAPRKPAAAPLAKMRAAQPQPRVRWNRRAPSAVSLIVLSACVALVLLGVGVLQAMDPAILSVFWSPGETGHTFDRDGADEGPQVGATYYTVPVGVTPPSAGDPGDLSDPVLPAAAPTPATPAPDTERDNPFVSRLSDASSPPSSPATP